MPVVENRKIIFSECSHEKNLIITWHVYKHVLTSLKIILIECVRVCIRERTNGQEENENELDENIMRSGTLVTNLNSLGRVKHNLCVSRVCS